MATCGNPWFIVRTLVVFAAAVVATVLVQSAEPPAVDPPLSPDEVLALVAADLATVPADRAATTRYLSLASLKDKEERATWAKMLGGHLNHLSREPDIVVPVRVGEYLLRFDALDYGRVFARAWESLAGAEPFWHLEEVQYSDGYEDVEYGHWRLPDGTASAKRSPGAVWVKTEVRKVKTDKVQKTVRGIVVRSEKAKQAYADVQVRLAAVGGKDTEVIVADGPWFLYQTAVNLHRSPGYYDFLGVGDIGDYEKAIGFTKKEIDPGFLKEVREVRANSEVTTPETLRRIVHFEKVGGDYWFTQDSNQKLAKDRFKANPKTNLGDDYEFQAIETYGHLPNGLWAMGLFDQAGKRQDVAPDVIASDSTGPRTDRKVHVYLSCVRCHTDGGMQDINGWARNVANRRPNFLAAQDPKEVRTLRQQYVTRRLEPFLQSSRLRYSTSLFTASGMKPEEYAGAVAGAWARYAEEPVTLERAARWIGTTPEKLKAGLAAQGEKVDPRLADFRLDDPEPIPVVDWFETVQRAMDAVGGVSRPFKVREGKK